MQQPKKLITTEAPLSSARTGGRAAGRPRAAALTLAAILPLRREVMVFVDRMT